MNLGQSSTKLTVLIVHQKGSHVLLAHKIAVTSNVSTLSLEELGSILQSSD